MSLAPAEGDPLATAMIGSTLLQLANDVLQASKRLQSTASSSTSQATPDGSLSTMRTPAPPERGSSTPSATTTTFRSRVPTSHWDDAIYFITVSTSPEAVEYLQSGNSSQWTASHRKAVLRGMLYSLSVMCRSDPPLNPLMEDDYRRNPLEVIIHGAIIVFVNLDWFTDMQKELLEEWSPQLTDIVSFLTDQCAALTKRGTRVTPVGRTNVPVRRVLALAAGLSCGVLRCCHRTVPAAAERSMQRLRQQVDGARRSYCGYDDATSLLSDLEQSLSQPNLHPFFREVLYWLNASCEVILTKAVSWSGDALCNSASRSRSEALATSAAQPFSSTSFLLGFGLSTTQQVQQCCSMSLAVCNAVCGLLQALEAWSGIRVFQEEQQFYGPYTNIRNDLRQLETESFLRLVVQYRRETRELAESIAFHQDLEELLESENRQRNDLIRNFQSQWNCILKNMQQTWIPGALHHPNARNLLSTVKQEELARERLVADARYSWNLITGACEVHRKDVSKRDEEEAIRFREEARAYLAGRGEVLSLPSLATPSSSQQTPPQPHKPTDGAAWAISASRPTSRAVSRSAQFASQSVMDRSAPPMESDCRVEVSPSVSAMLRSLQDEECVARELLEEHQRRVRDQFKRRENDAKDEATIASFTASLLQKRSAAVISPPPLPYKRLLAPAVAAAAPPTTTALVTAAMSATTSPPESRSSTPRLVISPRTGSTPSWSRGGGLSRH